MGADTLLKLIADEDAEYVDIRFTDPRGKLQHVTVMSDQVDADFIEDVSCLMAHQLRVGNLSKHLT